MPAVAERNWTSTEQLPPGKAPVVPASTPLAPVQKLLPVGMEKLLAFGPVIAFTAVIVAVEDEPFVRVINANAGLFTEANWKSAGFGFATTAAEPLP